MNERIKELHNQAFKETQDYYATMQKFAYLVIQDCLLALEPDPMAAEIDYDVEEKFYRRSAKKIQQHFGFEQWKHMILLNK